jgi:hypothetical protein
MRSGSLRLGCLASACLVNAGRALPAGERGSATGSLLTLSGSSVGQHIFDMLMLFNIFRHPSRSPASPCHSGTSNSLSQGLTRRAFLCSTACSLPLPGLCPDSLVIALAVYVPCGCLLARLALPLHTTNY